MCTVGRPGHVDDRIVRRPHSRTGGRRGGGRTRVRPGAPDTWTTGSCGGRAPPLAVGAAPGHVDSRAPGTRVRPSARCTCTAWRPIHVSGRIVRRPHSRTGGRLGRWVRGLPRRRRCLRARKETTQSFRAGIAVAKRLTCFLPRPKGGSGITRRRAPRPSCPQRSSPSPALRLRAQSDGSPERWQSDDEGDPGPRDTDLPCGGGGQRGSVSRGPGRRLVPRTASRPLRARR